MYKDSCNANCTLQLNLLNIEETWCLFLCLFLVLPYRVRKCPKEPI